MAYPRQLALRTYVTEVIPDPNITNDLVPVRRFVTDGNGDEKISGPPLPTFNSPVDTADARVLVSGLRRTSEVEQNQSESNPLTTVLLRCNTSIQPTIAPTEARNAVFYSSKYCSKKPYKLSSTLSFLYTAQLEIMDLSQMTSVHQHGLQNVSCKKCCTKRDILRWLINRLLQQILVMIPSFVDTNSAMCSSGMLSRG